MNKIPMTTDGYNRLQEELKRLKAVDRPAIIRAIAEARDHGDLAENAEYHSARDRQSFIEGRLAEIEDKIARAEIIDVSKLSGSVIKFGARVTLADEGELLLAHNEPQSAVLRGNVQVERSGVQPLQARAGRLTGAYGQGSWSGGTCAGHWTAERRS